MSGGRVQDIEFDKIEGCGNDFVFVDLRGRTLAEFTDRSRSELVPVLADRHYGVGSDGVVFVEKASTPEADVRWDFYNPDGSLAEMCGNAARCMGRWAQRHLSRDEIVFESRRGLVRVQAETDQVAATFSGLHLDFVPLTAEAKHLKVAGSLVNTGVPHVVVEVPHLQQAEGMREEIRALRHHLLAGPEGANVTFLERLGPTRFKSKTYERGVEAFTLSCGTGVIAAAAVGLRGNSQLKVDVETPGGTQSVTFSPDRTTVALTGPSTIVYTGIWRKGRP